LNSCSFGALAQLFGGTPMALRDFGDLLLGLGQELVQRRVEQADGDRQAGHDLEQFDEVGALHRQQLGERRAAAGFSSSARIISRMATMRSPSKNMCSVRQRPMPSAPNERAMRVGRRLGIGAHLHAADLVGPFHDAAKSPESSGCSIGTRPSAPGRWRRRW
jgi:hypothetical protein